MSDIFVQRDYDPPLTDDNFWQMARDAANCLDIYRVEWQRSLLSTDGRRLFCWFRAPDAESTRLALRKAGSEQAAPWPGTIHDAPAADAPPAEAANVVVERSFGAPVTLEEIQALERMVCLYRAPDAEAVREAQRKAKMPVDSVWSFELKS
jgi:hypothetical protein